MEDCRFTGKQERRGRRGQTLKGTSTSTIHRSSIDLITVQAYLSAYIARVLVHKQSPNLEPEPRCHRHGRRLNGSPRARLQLYHMSRTMHHAIYSDCRWSYWRKCSPTLAHPTCSHSLVHRNTFAGHFATRVLPSYGNEHGWTMILHSWFQTRRQTC